jgi:hypothetical protein
MDPIEPTSSGFLAEYSGLGLSGTFSGFLAIRLEPTSNQLLAEIEATSSGVTSTPLLSYIRLTIF